MTTWQTLSLAVAVILLFILIMAEILISDLKYYSMILALRAWLQLMSDFGLPAQLQLMFVTPRFWRHLITILTGWEHDLVILLDVDEQWRL